MKPRITEKQNKKANFLYQVLGGLLQQCEERETDYKSVHVNVPEQFRYYMEKYSKELEDDYFEKLLDWAPEDVDFTSSLGNDLVYLNRIQPLMKDARKYIESKYGINQVFSIEMIKDQKLKDKCLNLFGSEENKDTIIRDATTVLESKIRKLAKLPKEIYGSKLINDALKKDGGILTISKEGKARGRFHSLVLNFYEFYRHEPHHNLIEGLEWDRVAKILLFVDELIFLLEKANFNNENYSNWRTKYLKSKKNDTTKSRAE